LRLITKLTSFTILSPSSFKPIRCPNTILDDQPSKSLTLWRSPRLPNQRRHEGLGVAEEFHDVSRLEKVTSIICELPIYRVRRVGVQMLLKYLPKFCKLHMCSRDKPPWFLICATQSFCNIALLLFWEIINERGNIFRPHSIKPISLLEKSFLPISNGNHCSRCEQINILEVHVFPRPTQGFVSSSPCHNYLMRCAEANLLRFRILGHHNL
jgi:hypothetical protein